MDKKPRPRKVQISRPVSVPRVEPKEEPKPRRVAKSKPPAQAPVKPRALKATFNRVSYTDATTYRASSQVDILLEEARAMGGEFATHTRLRARLKLALNAVEAGNWQLVGDSGVNALSRAQRAQLGAARALLEIDASAILERATQLLTQPKKNSTLLAWFNSTRDSWNMCEMALDIAQRRLIGLREQLKDVGNLKEALETMKIDIFALQLIMLKLPHTEANQVAGHGRVRNLMGAIASLIMVEEQHQQLLVHIEQQLASIDQFMTVTLPAHQLKKTLPRS